jgi:DNA-binding MarR family transcriptional regulator
MMPLLKLRFTPEEAQFLAKIPFIGHTVEKLSENLDIPVKKLKKKLDKLARKGIIFRSEGRSEVRYSLTDSLFDFYRSIGWKGKNTTNLVVKFLLY